MSVLVDVRGSWRRGVRALLRSWVKATIKPEDAASHMAARHRAVCYVLERASQADLGVLDNTCAELNLPRPEQRLASGERRLDRAYFELTRASRMGGPRSRARAPRYLGQLVASAAADSAFDVDLVPVAIFWGRAPGKQESLWQLLFTEDWVLVGSFRRLLNVIFNGRNAVVYFGQAQSLREAMGGLDPQRSVRRVLRTLRGELRAQRASTIGPDLSHRRTIVGHVLKTLAVRRAVRREMRLNPQLSRRAALLRARKYALEIAANYSQTFVTFMSSVLTRLWNRLYDGVEVQHVEKLREIADRTEIIYAPCHRSHMDYLLLSYVIYHKGFAVPHVAGGVNLNLPVIGRFLRMGGAFFMRRSFKGDALYAAVFNQYLGFMMARGHPLEYFIEGGRSRTGRLLAPRTGMLSMTVRGFLENPKRPVAFVPVYFGYERIVEGRTYIGELSGRPKEKESVLGLLKSLPALKSKFGKVHVNLGEPILLEEHLQRCNPQWRGAPPEEETVRSGWIGEAIDQLAVRITAGINAAAAVTPINLVAMAMLATPRQAMLEADLIRQLALYQRLLEYAPYGPLVTVTRESGAQMVQYAESMGMLERQRHPLGDILRMSEENAVLATYYRNNILHLFVMPSLLACCFIGNAAMGTLDIQRLVWRVYPYICAELALRWPEAEIGAVTEALLDAFVRASLLEVNEARTEWRRAAPTSHEAIQLSLLAQATIQTVERYYLVIALLMQAGSGRIGREALVQRCQWMAQRMSVLYGLNSPEFFDRSLFHNFIDLLCRRSVLQTAEDGTLAFGDALLGVAADAQLVLSEQIRHDILQVTLSQ